MKIQFRNYHHDSLFSSDYIAVRNFLIQQNVSYFHFGRFDWMMTHSLLDPKDLNKIGIWEEDEKIMAVSLFDCVLGDAFLIHSSDDEALLISMIKEAEVNLSKAGQLRICVSQQDEALIKGMQSLGYHPSEESEFELRFDLLNHDISYEIEDEYRIDSMDKNKDMFHYGEVLWKGFNHELEGEGPFVWNEEKKLSYEREFDRPNIDGSLKIMAIHKEGAFVSYVGFFLDPKSNTALLEPLATDPKFRRKGFAKAVVYEGLKRLQNKGIRYVLVGSNQAFYHAIGFKAYHQSTWWIK